MSCGNVLRPVAGSLIAFLLAILAPVSISAQGLQAGSPWPKFGGNAGNTGLGVASGATSALEWSFSGGYFNFDGIAIGANSMLYMGATSTQYIQSQQPVGSFLAVDGSSGNLQWSYQFQVMEEVSGVPAIGVDGTVYVPTGIEGPEEGGLSAFDGETGTLDWRLELPGIASPPAIGNDGTIYVTTLDESAGGPSYFFAVNPDGTVKWSKSIYNGAEESPLIGPDGTVYLTQPNYGNATTSYPLSIQATSPADGAVVWTYSLDGADSPAEVSLDANGYLYLSTQTVTPPNTQIFHLTKLDPSGNVVWDYQGEATGDFVSPPVLLPGDHVVAPVSNGLVCIDGATGSVVWQSSVGGDPGPPTVTPDGTLYLPVILSSAQESNPLVAINGQTGAQEWSVLTGFHPMTEPAIGSDGTLYCGFDMALCAFSSASLTGLYPSSASMLGGASNRGVVQVSKSGPKGYAVSMSSNNPALQVPASVTIPSSSTGVSFAITSSPVSTTQTATVNAKFGISTKQFAVALNPYPLAGFSVSPAAVFGGASSKGTLVLAGPAGPQGDAVALSSSSPDVSVPSSVLVASGSTAGSFSFTTHAVSSAEVDTITGSFGGKTQQASITLSPALSAFYESPSSVVGGQSTYGVVQLGAPAQAGGQAVSLLHGGSEISTPSTVTVPAGKKGISFLISSMPVSLNSTWTLVATMGSSKLTSSITLKPYPISAFYASPGSLVGGSVTHAVVQLAGKAGATGNKILLSSTSPLVSAPSSVTVPAGGTGVSFAVMTSKVSVATQVTVTATFAGSSKSEVITLAPG